jgi:hypothetical protein
MRRKIGLHRLRGTRRAVRLEYRSRYPQRCVGGYLVKASVNRPQYCQYREAERHLGGYAPLIAAQYKPILQRVELCIVTRSTAILQHVPVLVLTKPERDVKSNVRVYAIALR